MPETRNSSRLPVHANLRDILFREGHPVKRFRRTMLFLPGGNQKLLSKALTLDVDAIILDLEDSVAPEMKGEARAHVAMALREESFQEREKVVRINSLKTEFGYDDVNALLKSKADTFLIPKVESPDDIKDVDIIVSETEERGETVPQKIELMALIETPLGILDVDRIALRSPRLTGLLFGAGDLVRETTGQITVDRKELYYPLTRILLAARAANIDAIDSPFFDVRDAQGVEREAIQAKLLGYDGKAVIHPNQVDVVNRIFTPTDNEIALAKRIIEAHEKAKSEGKGATTVDGKLVENVHAAIAERTLNIAKRAGKI